MSPQSEKTSRNTTPRSTPGDINEITSSGVTCARCDKPFEKRPEPIFRRWLEGFCETCKPAIQEEERKKGAAVIAEEQARQRKSRERSIIEARIKALGGGDVKNVVPYEDYTFEKYNASLNDTHGWLNYIRNFPLDAQNLFVYGPVGSGKTRLCTAAVRAMWDKMPPGSARVLTAKQFTVYVRHNGARARNYYEQQEAMKEYAAIDALFIDEIHEIQDREKDVILLKELIDYREHRRKFGLILVANVDLEKVAQVMGLPLADRMDGPGWEFFRIPETTTSARGLLRQREKKK